MPLTTPDPKPLQPTALGTTQEEREARRQVFQQKQLAKSRYERRQRLGRSITDQDGLAVLEVYKRLKAKAAR